MRRPLRPATCDLRPATCDLRPATCDLGTHPDHDVLLRRKNASKLWYTCARSLANENFMTRLAHGGAWSKWNYFIVMGDGMVLQPLLGVAIAKRAFELDAHEVVGQDVQARAQSGAIAA